jgi:AcrR family transcriptional regulator
MATAEPAPRARRSAAERREEIVTHAVEHFAQKGYAGASTEAIARDAGISQPYLFRLFRTKRELFLACYDRNQARIADAFARAAAGAPPEERLERMGKAYIDLLGDRTALLFQMQSYAACADPEIQAHVRGRYGELVQRVTRLAEAPPRAVFTFFAHGMLLNVIASLDLAEVADEDEWARAWASPEPLIVEASAGRGRC